MARAWRPAWASPGRKVLALEVVLNWNKEIKELLEVNKISWNKLFECFLCLVIFWNKRKVWNHVASVEWLFLFASCMTTD